MQLAILCFLLHLNSYLLPLVNSSINNLQESSNSSHDQSPSSTSIITPEEHRLQRTKRSPSWLDAFSYQKSNFVIQKLVFEYTTANLLGKMFYNLASGRPEKAEMEYAMLELKSARMKQPNKEVPIPPDLVKMYREEIDLKSSTQRWYILSLILLGVLVVTPLIGAYFETDVTINMTTPSRMQLANQANVLQHDLFTSNRVLIATLLILMLSIVSMLVALKWYRHVKLVVDENGALRVTTSTTKRRTRKTPKRKHNDGH